MLRFITLALTLPRLILAFGGEDPVKGKPFYHEKITRDGAKDAGGWDSGEIGETPAQPSAGQLPARPGNDGVTELVAATAPAADRAPTATATLVRSTDDPAKSAVSSLAWHADYVDSYLYNMVWNAGGGLDRFKSALIAHDDLIKVHFDDLTSTTQINVMWQRYLAGTVAGLMWAAEREDVPAARHIIGVGLHAAQDFYSHSNWVDDKNKRAAPEKLVTWFDVPASERNGLFLYTGTYEQQDQHGFKHHSKLAFDCKIMHEINDFLDMNVMDLLCSGFGPLSNTGLCRRWRECKLNSIPVHPDTVLGVKVPDGIVYLAPPGIALDSEWLSQINVVNRDLPELSGPTPPDNKELGKKMFAAAQGMAKKHTMQWLNQLQDIMVKAGHGPFWNQVKTRERDGEIVGPNIPVLSDFLTAYAEDVHQYEQRDKLPMTFLSAGAYPPAPNGGDEGWFVRMILSTADDEFGTGTNSDIDVEIGGKTFRLDHGSEENLLFEFNDFESGDHTQYVVGPLAARPGDMRLKNNGTTLFEIIEAAWEDLKNAVESFFETIGEFLLSLLGAHADYVGADKKTWTWEELDQIAELGGGVEFTWFVDGDDLGKHEIVGKIVCTRLPNGSIDAAVEMRLLRCIEEGPLDEPSDDIFDDEIMLMMLVNSPATGQVARFRTSPIDNVDSDEAHDVFMDPITVNVPRHGGLIVPIQVWESDLEGDSGRDRLLRGFASKYEEDTGGFQSAFLDAIGAAVLPDWKLRAVDAFAFRRGVVTETAYLARNKQVDRWIEAGSSLTIPFDKSPTRRTVVPALMPAKKTFTMNPGASVNSVEVGPTGVFAAAAPSLANPAPLGPAAVRRFGLHLEPGPQFMSQPPVRNMAVDPVHKRLYTVTHSEGVRMYDTETMAHLGTVNLGIGVTYIAVDSAARRVYVSRWRYPNAGVVVLDADSLAVLSEYTDDEGFLGPQGLAVDSELNRVIVARHYHDNMNTPPVTGMSVLERKPDDTLDHLVSLEMSPVQLQPTDVALDAPVGFLYLACLGANFPGGQPRLSIVDRMVPFVKGTVMLPGPARAVASNPGSGLAYVVGEAGLSIVDAKAKALLLTVPLGKQPHAVAVDSSTGVIYVADRMDGTITRIDAPAGIR